MGTIQGIQMSWISRVRVRCFNFIAKGSIAILKLLGSVKTQNSDNHDFQRWGDLRMALHDVSQSVN